MKKFVVINRTGISIHTGLVQLDEKQAARRSGKLAAVKDRPGVYEIKSPTMFKCGEKFGYDGAISKAMMTEIEDETAAEKRKQEEAKKAEEVKPAAPKARK